MKEAMKKNKCQWACNSSSQISQNPLNTDKWRNTNQSVKLIKIYELFVLHWSIIYFDDFFVE